MLFRRRKYFLLPDWLDIATKGLCREAKERIRIEIEAHFKEAFQEQLEKGLTGVNALFAATATLGHPRKARRQFRKTYLTKGQERALEQLKSPGSDPEIRGYRLIGVCGLPIMAIVMASGARQPIPLLLSVLALSGFIHLWRWKIVRRKCAPRPTLIASVGFMSFTLAILFLILLAFGHEEFSDKPFRYAAIMGCVPVFILAYYFPLMRKLKRNGSRRDPM